MSSSLTKDLANYRKSRLPLSVFVPLTLFLCTSVAAVQWPKRWSDWAINLIAAFFLVAQFRLWDDLASVEADQQKHPQRVLCKTDSLGPFWLVLGLLFVVNLGLVFVLKSTNAVFALVTLNLFFIVWYFMSNRLTSLAMSGTKVSDPNCREPAIRVLRTTGVRHLFSAQSLPIISQAVLIKYPVIVVILSIQSQGNALGKLACIALLTFLCFGVYELLHDSSLHAVCYFKHMLLIELAATLVVGICILYELTFKSPTAAVLHAGLLLLGASVVLTRCLPVRTNGDTSRWNYTIFLVGFSWLVNYTIATS